MKRKSVTLSIKSVDDEAGTFTGLASVFDNLDAHGDIVRRGAFTKSLTAGQPVPLIWEHKADDPRNYVGDVIEATETAEGLAIAGKFDLTTEHGQAAYRNVKGRRVGGLSIGYHVRNQTKTAAGNELTDLDLVEISIVARGANDRALIGSVKSAGRPTAPIRSALAKATAARYLKENPAMMTNAKLQTLKKDRDSQLALVKQIIDTADELGRDLTADEAQRVEEATAAAKSLDTGIEQAKADLEVLAQAKALAAEIGPLDDSANSPDSTEGKHLAISGKHRKAIARKLIGKDGAKALVASGSRSTGVVMDSQVYEQGRPPQSILDVLNARQVAPNYSFLQQTTRTNNAAPVEAGATKPTSVYTLTEREAKLQVIAHLSEQIPIHTLGDNANLEQFVGDEMVYGLQVAIENQVINGNGTAPALRGILATSGIQTQVFATDILTSIRKGITKLESQGMSADILIVSATDWEAVELLAATNGATDVRGVPIDATTRRLWGVQAVVSNVLPAKTSVLLDQSSVSVDHDGAIDTKWSDAVSDDFAKNLIRCRVEGRFGLSVFRPLGVVSVATAAS